MPAKPRASPKRSSDPCAQLKRKLKEREAELKEARDQQAVTSELLRIISSFPSSPQPVFDAIVKSAARLFGGLDVSLRLVIGDQLEAMATTLPEKHAGRLSRPVNDEAYPTTRSILRKELIVLPDVLTEDWVSDAAKQRASSAGFRGFICVPMLKDGVVIGVINVLRSTPGPFTDDQIALVKTFADQAVIAIENVRLVHELRARNADLTEALAQQTATSEILRIISSSPADLQPVFDAILDNAMRLCDAHLGTLGLHDGEKFEYVVQRGGGPGFSEQLVHRGRFIPSEERICGA